MASSRTTARKSTRDTLPAETVIEEIVAKASGETSTRRYNKGRFLGKGGFARVYEIVSLDTRKVYAGKVVPKSALTRSRAKQKLMSEIKIHRSLKHENVVQFEHFFEDAENVYILLEICTNQSLSELLRRRKRLTEIEVQCYLLQVISALLYAHSKKVIHRDLKIGNLFLSEKMQVKLGDFGLSTKVEYEGEKKKTVCGTPNYIAPEVLEGKCGHSYEVDVWSLGVVMYTLLVGKPPFETNDVKKTYNLIRMNAYSFPEHLGISEQAKSLITRILRNDPSKRPGLNDILAHEFFHMGNSIPKLLPVSTLAVPPSDHYIAEFLPRSKNVPYYPKTETAPISLKALRASTGSKEFLLTQKPKSRHSDKRLGYKKLPNPTAEKPAKPAIWVKKWVDYSSKYGLGYILSNGCAGVYFNDSTKVVLEPNSTTFTYIEKDKKKTDCFSEHSLENYPKPLYKKVTLLQHFRSYLETELETLQPGGPMRPMIYVKKWMRTKRAILFRLSNKVVQVCFQDHTEIILSSESKLVTYVNKQAERITLTLEDAVESANTELAKRLKYTKDIMNYMMSTPSGGTGSPPLSNRNV